MKFRWLVAPVLCVAAAVAVVLLFGSMKRDSIQALRANMLAVSQRYPKFTMAQRRAVLAEWKSEMHPRFQDLSAAEVARRFLAAATETTGSAVAPPANFFGNLTAINGLGGDILGLERTSTCSLNMGSANWTLSLPTFTYTVDGPLTPNYDQILHNEAQLKTNGGNWPAGCGDPKTGIPTRQVAYVGKTIAGNKIYAGALYGGAANYLEVVVANGSTDAEISSEEIAGLSNPLAVVAADLNGDGNPDLVVLGDGINEGEAGTVSVLLGDANGDGGFGAPTNYNLGGESAEGAVIDDFNGDGKLDIVATSENFTTGTTYSLTWLEGNGDGTFAAPQNVTLTPPSGYNGNAYSAMISASLRNNGKKDIITPAGIVLFGNGDGTFTQAATLAFPGHGSSLQLGSNIVAGDFNKDGKMDIALDDGVSIAIFLGNGDGTFNSGNAYATINNTGYLSGTDLDGDGNPDLYSGVGGPGMFGGDQFEYNQGYALMGNGDGTFQGAPAMPFVFTGTNLIDLNGDKIPDGVGVDTTLNSQNVSMTSYLGNSNGSFTAKQTFQISPVTIGTTTLQFSGLDSFGLGDFTGSGKVDLAYLPPDFYGPGGVAGYFVAMGNGDGTFNTPTFVAAPTFAPTGDFDQSAYLTGLFVADVNGDGKADLIYSYSVEVYQTGTYEQGIAVQLSNGDGTFAAPTGIQTYSSTTAPTGAAPFVVQLGHTRAGGPLDLFVETATTNSTSVTYTLQLYLGKGDGTFGAGTIPPVADNFEFPSFGAEVAPIVIADMNGDGKPDLVTLGTTTSTNQGELAISLGNGDGTFQKPTIVDFGYGSTIGYALAVADVNGDGKMDVAVAGFNPPLDTGIFLGNGDGTVQSFQGATGIAEPAEGIDLILFGAGGTADFNGDGKPDLVLGSAVLINLGATSTLIPTTTTVTASATTVTFGTNVTLTATVSGSLTPTGSVTFMDGNTALGTTTLNGSGVGMYSTSALAVGVHSITAVYGANSTFGGSTSPAVAITVNQPVLPGTTSALTASATTVTTGANVTFTDTVTPAAGATGMPTGAVTFMNGTTNLGSGTLNSSGVATLSTTALPVGADAVTAIYAGDTNFQGSTSNAVTVTVNAVTPSFTMSASPTSATVTAGNSTTTTITVTPTNGFNAQVGFACTGLPTGGTCTFSPTTVTPNGTAASTTTLTIGTTTTSGALKMLERPGSRSGGATTLAVLAAGVLWVFGRRKNVPWMRLMPLMVVLLAAAAVAIGCGGGSGNSGGGGGGGTQPTTYTVTVTGTAGSQSQTATFSLTVN